MQRDPPPRSNPHLPGRGDAAVAARQHQQLAPAIDQQADLVVDLQCGRIVESYDGYEIQ